jgi:hypothetical protein
MTTKLKPRKLPPNPDSRKVLMAFKVSMAEAEEISRLSAIFSDKNVSEWVRRAALRYRPAPDHGRKKP